MKELAAFLVILFFFNSCKKEEDIDKPSSSANVVASFSYTAIDIGDSIKSYTFKNLSTGATKYKWYFGTSDSSDAFEPTFQVKKSGSYKVTLIASNTSNSSTKSNLIFTTFIDTTKDPISLFEVYYNIDTPFVIRFQNLSKNYTKLTWKFGDNTSSNELNPIHYYATYTHHKIYLIAENNKGKDSMFVDLYHISNFDFSNKPTLYLTNSSPATILTQQLEFYQTSYTITHISYTENITENPEEFIGKSSHSFNNLLPHSYFLYWKSDNVTAYQKRLTPDFSTAKSLFTSLAGNYNFKLRKKIATNSMSTHIDSVHYRDTVLNVSFINNAKIEIRDNQNNHLFNGYLCSKSNSNTFVFEEILSYTMNQETYNQISVPQTLDKLSVLFYDRYGTKAVATTTIRYEGSR